MRAGLIDAYVTRRLNDGRRGARKGQGMQSGAPHGGRALVTTPRTRNERGLLSAAGFRGKFCATFAADHGVAAGSAASSGGDGMRVTRRLALAAMVAAGAATGWGSARADWRDELPVFRIGILGGELVDLQLKDHACLKTRAEKALGVPVQLFASRDYSGLTEGLLAGRLDTALLGAAGYASIYLQKPDAVEPIVTVEEKDGTLGYRSVLLVRADSPYQTIDDLRGKTLVFTERLSTSGFLIPYYELSQRGYEPGRFFGQLAFSGGHPEAVAAVLNRQADAGVTWTSGIGDQDKGYSRGNLRRLVDLGALDMRELRILWTSELIPADPQVVRKDLPREAKEIYRDLLLNLAERDRRCFEHMVGGQAQDFKEISHDAYKTIIAIQRKGEDGSGS
jgi:phosphonate transport system substrate-binding protein